MDVFTAPKLLRAHAKHDVETFGVRAIFISADAADSAQVDAAAERIERELRPLDIWVNNAMATIFAPLDVLRKTSRRSRIHTRMRFWLAWGVLGFGLPAAIAATLKVIRFVIPAALHGSVGQRFLLWTAGPAIAEWLFVLALWFVLRSRKQSFRELGVWRFGNAKAWALALLLAAVSIASNLRLLPLMHVPIVNAFVPRGFHLAAALAMGLTTGCCEEVLFRAFLMVEAANEGYSKALQVVLPGIAFGFAHLGYSNHGLTAVIGIMVPTAVLGMLWGIAYLLGRRILGPCMAAHFLNDATALPWINFFLFTGGLG